MPGETVLGLTHAGVPAQLRGKRRDALVRDAAGHDQVEEIDVGRDIERESVTRNPAGNADADRADLFITNPGAAESLHAPGLESVARADTDHHFLEVANVAMHVAPIGIEVDDRITHQLAGAVVGHVAAAARLEDVDAKRGE